MNLPSNPPSNEIPAGTVRVAKASFRKGNALMRLLDECGPLFREEEFGDLYSWKGEVGISPVQHLATATALNWGRLAAWLVDHSPAQTRISVFAELAPTLPPPLALALP